MQKIILASQSLQRKMIFETLNLPFEIIPANLDEKAITDPVIKVRAEKVARAKAEKIVKEHSGIIIAADTFCVVHGKIFEKPESKDEAKAMLQEMSGTSSLCYTSFCYIDRKNNIDFSTVLEIPFTLRPISQDEIDHYVENNSVTTWSAGIAPAYIESMSFVEKINGSFTAFIHGLPMELVVEYLKKSGVKI